MPYSMGITVKAFSVLSVVFTITEHYSDSFSVPEVNLTLNWQKINLLFSVYEHNINCIEESNF